MTIDPQELQQLIEMFRGAGDETVEESFGVLYEAGLIEPSGDTRAGQPVWVITEQGVHVGEELQRRETIKEKRNLPRQRVRPRKDQSPE